jgi:hypothetical protein
LNIGWLVKRIGPGWHRYANPQPGRDYEASAHSIETRAPSFGPFRGTPGMLRWSRKSRPVFYANPVQIPLDTGVPLWAEPWPPVVVAPPGNVRLKSPFASLLSGCPQGRCNGPNVYGANLANNPNLTIAPASTAAATNNPSIGSNNPYTPIDYSLFGYTQANGTASGAYNGQGGSGATSSGGGNTASGSGASTSGYTLYGVPPTTQVTAT